MHNDCFRYLVFLVMHLLKKCVIFNLKLQALFSGYTYGVWLGFSDIQTEGQFVSLTDARSVRYANWMAGYPNNLNGAEHCAMYWWSHKGWNDSPCSQKINYACTKPIENN